MDPITIKLGPTGTMLLSGPGTRFPNRAKPLAWSGQLAIHYQAIISVGSSSKALHRTYRSPTEQMLSVVDGLRI